jgi:NADH dehydrogenase/NADH:ubiquinone oxidoreductase subunit G
MTTLTLHINGQPASVPAGCSVAAALAHAGTAIEACAPFCGVGQCQACRVTIDGMAHRLACMTPVADGMVVETPA